MRKGYLSHSLGQSKDSGKPAHPLKPSLLAHTQYMAIKEASDLSGPTVVPVYADFNHPKPHDIKVPFIANKADPDLY